MPFRSRPLALTGLALAALLGRACDPGSAPGAAAADVAAGRDPAAAPDPSGAVLSVDGLWIRPQDVDPLADEVQLLFPEYTRVHARRLALTNEILPRLAARSRHPETWAAAREACAEAEAHLEELTPWVQQGTWKVLGLALWGVVRRLEPGVWSPPVELVGRWVRVRLDERTPASEPSQEVFEVSLLDFPYLELTTLAATVQEAIDSVRLEILAPEWDATVPEAWKHRMRGGAR